MPRLETRSIVTLMAFSLLLQLLAVSFAAAQSQHITRTITRSITKSITGQVRARMIRPTLKIKDPVTTALAASAGQNGEALAVQIDQGTLRLWDLTRGAEPKSLTVVGDRITAFDPGVGGRIAFVGTASGRLKLFDMADGREVIDRHLAQTGLTALQYHGGSGLLAAAWGDRLALFAVTATDQFGLEERWQASLPAQRLGALRFSAAGDRLAVLVDDNHLALFDPASGGAGGRIAAASPIAAFGFTAKGAVALATRQGGVEIWRDGRRQRVLGSGLSGVTAMALAPDAPRAIIGNRAGQVAALDLDSGQILATIEAHESPVVGLWSENDGERAISVAGDAEIRVLDLTSGDTLAQIITTTRGWAVIDHLGRFDGSEVGFQDVNWSLDDEDLPLDRFARQYFEPGLLAAHLEGTKEFLVDPPAPLEAGVPPPPHVEIDFPEPELALDKPVYLVVVAEDRGGGIEEVRLYHNGKLVEPGSKLQQQDVEEGGQHLRAAAFQVKPVAGLNTFKAVADGLWQIEGHSERHTKDFRGQAAPSTLHVVAVGINSYSDPSLDLNYSVPDANAIVAALEQGARGGPFTRVAVHKLTDEGATKEAILRVLAEVKQSAPQDVVVFYLAGHGLVVGKDWLFLPHEARSLKQPAGYKKVALSAREFQQALVEVRAQRVLVMIDSCQSGAGVRNFAKYPSFQRRYLSELSRVAGVTVLSATRPDQYAAEMSSIGHGVFTYVVLQGLAGEADKLPQDGKVSAHELVGYAARAIPPMTIKYGIRQEPAAFALGADFSLLEP